ncbi:YceI family protein [Saccharicrinis aurantiacus]|uniref:YceI family protein n=1 Tax=Saccharicrinis aurantiacus TaxID=1849719 RepID=UPI00094F92B7|nr:YceI family protein [Saccharicrinis aurantiacus]
MKNLNVLLTAIFLLSAIGVQAKKIEVDTQKSTIKWEGKKVGGAHNGFVKLKDAKLAIKNDIITDGEFIIDMASITNTDIDNEEYNQKLVGHLKSDDFFGVEKYPTSKLIITNSSTFKNGVAKVSGNLSIKGKTHPIDFEVKQNSNGYITTLVIDRSKYNVRYGSSSFFDNLGDKVIYDEFTLEVNLITK